jgi:hypothetical protein
VAALTAREVKLTPGGKSALLNFPLMPDEGGRQVAVSFQDDHLRLPSATCPDLVFTSKLQKI